MVTRDLFDATIVELVAARVADVADRSRPILDESHCEHACHSLPLGTSGGEAMDFVVGNGDRFANPLADGAGLALEPLAQHAQRDVGSLSAGRLPSDTVDDDEQPARFVNVKAILVHLTMKTGIGGTGGGDRAERRHIARSAAPRFQQPHLPGDYGDERDEEDVARDEQQGHCDTTTKSR